METGGGLVCQGIITDVPALFPACMNANTGNEGERLGFPPLRLHNPSQRLPLVEHLLQERFLAQLHAGVDFNSIRMGDYLHTFHVKRRTSHCHPGCAKKPA